MYANSIVELIGNTPLLHLPSLSDAGRGIQVYGKLECRNPGGSVKDADVIAACNKHGIAMVFTGRRHFTH